MKLPEDKKERTKILVLIGIGAIVVVVLLFEMPVVGILPLLETKKVKTEQIAKLKLDIEKADKESRKLDRDKAENLEVLEKIIGISDKYILKAELGINYKLSAEKYIDPFAKKLNIKIEQIRQVGISAETAQAAIRTYTARVSTFCSYNDLVKLVSEIETNNPYITVANIAVTSQPDDFRKHNCSFEVQWPVWNDIDMPAKLQKQLKDSSKIAEAGTK